MLAQLRSRPCARRGSGCRLRRGARLTAELAARGAGCAGPWIYRPPLVISRASRLPVDLAGRVTFASGRHAGRQAGAVFDQGHGELDSLTDYQQDAPTSTQRIGNARRPQPGAVVLRCAAHTRLLMANDGNAGKLFHRSEPFAVMIPGIRASLAHGCANAGRNPRSGAWLVSPFLH